MLRQEKVICNRNAMAKRGQLLHMQPMAIHSDIAKPFDFCQDTRIGGRKNNSGIPYVPKISHTMEWKRQGGYGEGGEGEINREREGQ